MTFLIPYRTGTRPEPEPLPVDPDEQTPEQRARLWTAELSKRLFDRQPIIERHRSYFEGTQPQRFATEAWTEAFGEKFALRNNWMPMVVSAVTSRMEVQGFRLDATDPEPDEDAWDIWQANQMDLMSEVLHTDLVVTGWAYTLIWPDENGDPRITVEDPLQAIVMRDPGDRRRILAGLKRWRDLTGTWRALLFTPDTVWTLLGGTGGTPATDWEIEQAEDNPLGTVPLVEFLNNPDARLEGHSDLEPVEELQDALDKTFADMLVASEYTAYRQRILIGGEVPTDEDGEPVTQAEFGINRLFAIESDAQIQELSAGDLSNYTKVADTIRTDIAAKTNTPPQQLLGTMVNISGDALKAAMDGLVYRARRKHRWCGESWEQTMRLSFRVMDLEEMAIAAETVWKDPETASEATRVDALLKLRQLGLPIEAIWELYGASPQLAKRWLEMMRREASLRGMELGISGESGLPVESGFPDGSAGDPDGLAGGAGAGTAAFATA
ncbi:MAG: phage portal protein [Solirubrobacteraceae bacterium]